MKWYLRMRAAFFFIPKKYVDLVRGQVFLQTRDRGEFSSSRGDTQPALLLDLAQDFYTETAEGIA